VRLAELRDRGLRELSGGQQQRVAIAAVLGLLTGAGWMAWTFIRRTVGG
jgi:ABC-type enterochelin transport system ATPase subunit